MTLELAHKIFIYKDGVLYWKKNNKVCGHLDKSNGYIRIRYKEGFYYAHRIIYLMHYGYFPEYIDHIDRCKTNNNINNLREVSQSENCRNVNVKKNNKLGYKGISIHKGSGLYRANICINRKQNLIGYYKTLDEAIIGYNNYLNQLNNGTEKTELR